jgi:two-component system NtrC family sensor kinase
MLSLVEESVGNTTNWLEVSLEGGRVFSVQLTPIPNIGQAVTMYDITYLKKLDAIKTDFVNTVSHDLRSPLTAIMGYVDLIERTGTVTDMQRDFIHRVQLSVHNISTLVDDLLRLGRIEADADSRKDDVYLDQLIGYVGEQLAERFDQHSHHFVYERPQTFPPIKANPMQMQSLIENLLENAIKYTPEGGTISVYTKVEKKQVVMQISDNGIGIPALDLPYIFDKFYRASNVDSDVIGTGLGLSIVKSVVENHQGRIWVDSKQGQGTTFSVVLPLLDEKER